MTLPSPVVEWMSTVDGVGESYKPEIWGVFPIPALRSIELNIYSILKGVGRKG